MGAFCAIHLKMAFTTAASGDLTIDGRRRRSERDQAGNYLGLFGAASPEPGDADGGPDCGPGWMLDALRFQRPPIWMRSALQLRTMQLPRARQRQ